MEGRKNAVPLTPRLSDRVHAFTVRDAPADAVSAEFIAMNPPIFTVQVFGDLGALVAAASWVVVFERAVVVAPLPEMMLAHDGTLLPAVDVHGANDASTPPDLAASIPNLPILRAGNLRAWETVRRQVKRDALLGRRLDSDPVVGKEVAAALLGVPRDALENVVRRLPAAQVPRYRGKQRRPIYWWRDRATLVDWWKTALGETSAAEPLTSWAAVIEVLGVSRTTLSRRRRARRDRTPPWFADADAVRAWWVDLIAGPSVRSPTPRHRRSVVGPVADPEYTLANLVAGKLP